MNFDESLFEGLVDAFDVESFSRLVKFEYQINLSKEVNLNQSTRDIVADFLEHFENLYGSENQDAKKKLLAKALARRRNNSSLRALAERHGIKAKS